MTAPDARTLAQSLMAQRDSLRTELDSQYEILKANNCTGSEPLVDAAGFPRAGCRHLLSQESSRQDNRVAERPVTCDGRNRKSPRRCLCPTSQRDDRSDTDRWTACGRANTVCPRRWCRSAKSGSQRCQYDRPRIVAILEAYAFDSATGTSAWRLGHQVWFSHSCFFRRGIFDAARRVCWREREREHLFARCVVAPEQFPSAPFLSKFCATELPSSCLLRRGQGGVAAECSGWSVSQRVGTHAELNSQMPYCPVQGMTTARCALSPFLGRAISAVYFSVAKSMNCTTSQPDIEGPLSCTIYRSHCPCS